MFDHNLHFKRETEKTDNEKRYEEIEALAKKAIEGDNDALYKLCEEQARSILFRAKYMLGNEMDAEDVAQNVLLRVCENIRDLRKPKAFNAWLSRIVVNETRRYMAARAKRGQVEDIDDFMEELAEDDAQLLPGEYVEDASVHDAIMEIVSRLPVRQREAIILHYYDELKVTEVARAMGIPHQSASRYLSLARKKLRAELEGMGLEYGFENTGHKDRGHKDTGQKDTGHKDTGQKDTGHKDTGYKDTVYKDTSQKDTGHKDTGYKDTGHKDTDLEIMDIENTDIDDNYRYVS